MPEETPAPPEKPASPPPAPESPAAEPEDLGRTVEVAVELDDKGAGVVGRHAADVLRVNGKGDGFELATIGEGLTRVTVAGGHGTAKVLVRRSDNDPDE